MIQKRLDILSTENQAITLVRAYIEMEITKALEILNNNSSGRVYTKQEAALIIDFYKSLASAEAKEVKKELALNGNSKDS
ncbi:MAG: hypothetical protein HWE07_05795 [Cytophagia bacterium]|nr:hypothetical protein [Cytophagia bacterium]